MNPQSFYHHHQLVKSLARIRLNSSAPASGWAMLPSRALLQLQCDGVAGITSLHNVNGEIRRWEDPLAALAWMERFESLPDPAGRWVGFISYDLGRLFETLPARAIDDLNLPLFVFTYHAPSNGPDEPEPTRFHPRSATPTPFLHSTFSQQAYEASVQRSIDYIAAGDIFQVNLSQRFTTNLPAPPQVIYQRLLDHTPAWYGALLEYENFALISNSPELFLHVTPRPDGLRRVITRPIKGTRPRLAGMDRTLLDSVKDQAELNMIIDLERNDLGRVAQVGSVRVIEPRTIEAHPTVYHGVATIEAFLQSGIGFVELLRATFPGGSITGAPKIRAMQIIDELEPTRRGPYCGAIGYLTPAGHIQFNIAIRTMIATPSQVHIPVGGGIVADSVPRDEYEETLVKSRAMFQAIGI